jgi:hypothetical protein
LKYLDRHDIAKYNVGSVAIAKVGAMAAGMLVGKKSKIKPDDFLPFDTKKTQERRWRDRRKLDCSAALDEDEENGWTCYCIAC